MYTSRDMDVDVIIVHGPAGCSFMASRPLENAGVHVLTSSMKDGDLIFGGGPKLEAALVEAKEPFHPKSIAVVATCASTIIGDDIGAIIGHADLGDTVCFPIDCHGCMENNTDGAIKALEAGAVAGLIPVEEYHRQRELLKAATDLEKRRGMAGRTYLQPAVSPTKYAVCKKIIDALSAGRKVAVVMIAKKELAYRFADMFLAVEEAHSKVGGEVRYFANLDGSVGLPRIRRYVADIDRDLGKDGVKIHEVIGGLDEYAVVGDRMKEAIDGYAPDLRIVLGICHALPDLRPDDILVTDQPRELRNYLEQGLTAVGEISSHTMVMGAEGIVRLETADTIRVMLVDL
ncbi:MAG: Ni-sirohydrochlorin a,c-diamide reductive cyclase catalytic subunit [Candidatus Methanomethylophilaceae archaeon]|nr:Ni-sirohydrochlorin a,c-diamide reductive cyclase catalytic subunit [Candidatus Methanomethylophilaceae archaeon]